MSAAEPLDQIDLVPLRDAAHAEPYHAIRRVELFERYSPDLVYRGTADPDEHLPQNLGHVLLLNREVVGTIRIDLIDAERAGLRLVAVKRDHQNLGLGSWMLYRAETLVAAYGRQTIVVNAALAAAPFYLRHGYTEGDWTDVLSFNPDEQMRVGKRLV